MIIYLIKSIACLLILLLVHRVIFQREAIYKFNRFYLLAAVIGSFLIPLVEIEVAGEETYIPQSVSQELEHSLGVQFESYPEIVSNATKEPILVENSMDWSLVFWGVYCLITLVFLIRFTRNIKLLFDKIHRNIHVQFRGETLVLLNEQSLPFSFLSFIFVSRDYFESGQMTDSIFAHEQAHVQGRHSWDNLLIEGLLVIFWFHPGLYLAKQAIKLNHEFIADSAALKITPLEQYKTFLLAMMLPNQNPGLVSSLNFSLTKKRFEMMKRRTANSTMWIKILMILPILGALVYFFSEKVMVQEEVNSALFTATNDSENPEKNETSILLRADGRIEVDGQIIEVSQLAELLNARNYDYSLARISSEPEVEMGLLSDVQGILRDHEVREVVFDQVSQNQEETWQKELETHYKNAYILVEDVNMMYTHKTYSQLTDEEKKQLLPPMKPKEKEHPQSELFESWKDKTTYAIWIDNAVIPNEKLNDYTVADFVGFFQSGVKENARTDRFPQPYQVHLYSDAYYDKYFGPEAEDRQPRTNADTITLTQRRVTWHRDISRYPDPTTAYLQKYARYENLRTSGTIYIHKGPEEKAMLDELYRELEMEYSQSSDKRKKNLKEPISPSSEARRNGDSAKNTTDKINAQTVGNKGDAEIVYSLVFSPALQSDAMKEYLTLYGQYQTRAYENRLFSQPENSEILDQQILFRTLEAKFNGLSFEERRRVKRVNFPYIKIEKEGVISFKKIEDLTPEERKELGC